MIFTSSFACLENLLRFFFSITLIGIFSIVDFEFILGISFNSESLSINEIFSLPTLENEKVFSTILHEKGR